MPDESQKELFSYPMLNNNTKGFIQGYLAAKISK